MAIVMLAGARAVACCERCGLSNNCTGSMCMLLPSMHAYRTNALARYSLCINYISVL